MASTREQRKVRLMKEAETLIGEMLDWSDDTPEPNLTQIEDTVLLLRKRFSEAMAQEVIEGVTVGQRLLGASAEAVEIRQCLGAVQLEPQLPTRSQLQHEHHQPHHIIPRSWAYFSIPHSRFLIYPFSDLQK